MNIEKLANHISASLWLQKSKILEVLNTYKKVEEEQNAIPKERDYTGVKFKHSDNGKESIIEKCAYLEGYPYSLLNGAIHYTQKEVESLFSNGFWIEQIAENQPSENIGQLQTRIENAYVILDDVLKRLKLVENAIATPIVEIPKCSKKNLKTDDWKDKVCLSYNDVVQVGKKSESKMLDKQYYDNLQSVSNYVKQRL
jgi:hypothetical protein